jgi:hypothetical protein
MCFRSSVGILLLLALAGLAQEESEIEVESKPEAEPENAEEPAKPKPLGPAPAREPGQKLEWAVVQDRAKLFSLKLPTDWRHTERRAVQDGFTLSVLLPGIKDGYALTVTDCVWETCPAGGPAWIRGMREEDKGYSGSRIRPQPLPHVQLSYDWEKEEWVRLVAYARSRGRTLELALDVLREHRDFVLPDFLKAAASLKTTRRVWPEIPAGYKVIQANPFRIAVHPGVKASIKHILKTIKAAQKISNRKHKKLPAPTRDEPAPVIYIHRHRKDAVQILPRVAGNSDHVDVCYSGLAMFVFYYPPDAKDPPQFLSGEIGDFNAYRRWGRSVPTWVRIGERRVLRAEYDGGYRLPKMDAGYFRWGEGIDLGLLDELAEKNASDEWDSFAARSMLYVAFFHAGPSKYRKAYAKFLAETRSSCDPRLAFDKHLRSLGLETVREAAEKFRHHKIVMVDD